MRPSVEITIWDKYAPWLVKLRITVKGCSGAGCPGVRAQLIS